MKKALIILLAAALVFTAVSCKSNAAKADKAEGIALNGSYHNYKYSIGTKGPELDFTIEGNPTTGYQWVLLTEDDSFTLVSGNYKQNDAPEMMVGVGGKYKFVIDFLADGEHQLDFAYQRSWAPEDGPIHLSLKVTVKGSAITDVSVVE